jgi:hypothetical protein
VGNASPSTPAFLKYKNNVRRFLFQIERVEAFGEPAVDRSEKLACLFRLALIAQQPRKFDRSAKLPKLSLLSAGKPYSSILFATRTLGFVQCAEYIDGTPARARRSSQSSTKLRPYFREPQPPDCLQSAVEDAAVRPLTTPF